MACVTVAAAEVPVRACPLFSQPKFGFSLFKQNVQALSNSSQVFQADFTVLTRCSKLQGAADDCACESIGCHFDRSLDWLFGAGCGEYGNSGLSQA